MFQQSIFFFVVFMIHISGTASASSDRPENAKAPAGTIPYNKNLCKTADGREAFGFVRVKPNFDKDGCTNPVKAWTYDAKNAGWHTVKAKTVKCCDPTAEAGIEP